MTNLVLSRRAGDCVRLEMLPGECRYLTVAYVGGDQVKFELTGIPDGGLTKRINVGDSWLIGPSCTVKVLSINFRNVKIVRTELLERAASVTHRT